MITRQSLLGLRETLSRSAPHGELSLSDFGRMLGRAADRYPYSRSYVSKLLAGTKPITPQVARAVRVLMVSAAALEEKDGVDPGPTFRGEPVNKLKSARSSGVDWQGLYVQDPEVRAFVDALIDLITRG